ncbi:MAG TPA: DMT family transporter [Candidatus Limnocylindria bacterium]|nr:DMT family transporter [Candidatus Limnocylindria bacterium]
MNGGLDRATGLAFLGVVIVGGLNGVGVRFSNAELDHLWGAALRFGLASALLFAVVAIRRLPLPRGQALVGSVLYGLIGFALAYGFAYYGLIETPAGIAMVILALVPLLTLLLAVAHGLEKLRAQSLGGSLLALAGVALIFWERLETTAAPLLSLLAIVAAAFAIAETGVVVKRFPRAHPVSNNALAMAVGALALLAAALLFGQSIALPVGADTLGALAYLVVIGSVVLFMLFLFIIERWTASATSYSLLLMPLPAAVGGALLLGEPITIGLIVGGAVIVLGVYLGAFAPSLARPLPGLLRRPAPAGPPIDEMEARPADLIYPGCP